MGKLMALSLLCTMTPLCVPAALMAGRGSRSAARSRCSSLRRSSSRESRHTVEHRRTNWSTIDYQASSRPDDTQGQFGARQSAGVLSSFSYCRFIPFWPTWISCLPTISVRRPPSLARLSGGRSRALVRLRPVLCVARRLLMSCSFSLSGLFVWPSLERKGARIFLHDRVLRLAYRLPGGRIADAVANYRSYLQTAVDPGFLRFLGHWLALPFWSCGPMWFMWLLLAADFVAAGSTNTHPVG